MTDVNIELPEDEEQEIQSPEIGYDDDIQRAYQALGEQFSELKIKVYKIEKGNYDWIFDSDPETLTGIHELLQTEYGAGRYEVRLFGDGRMRSRIKLNIGSTLADRIKSTGNSRNDALPPSEVIGMVQRMQDAHMAQIKLMMETMMANFQATIHANHNPQPNISPLEMQKSTLEMMASMKTLMGDNKSSNTDPFDMITKVLQLQNELGAMSGESGTAAMMASIAKDTLPQLVELAGINQKMANKNPAPRQASRQPTKQPPQIKQQTPPQAKPNPTTEPTTEKDQDMMQFFLARAVNMLLTKAQRDGDPSAYAVVLLDTVEEYQAFDEVVEFMKQEDCINRLIGINPQVAQYKEWFEELREAALSMVEEETPEPQANIEPDLTNVTELDNTPTINSGEHLSKPRNAFVQHSDAANVDPRRIERNAHDIKNDVAPSQTIQEEYNNT